MTIHPLPKVASPRIKSGVATFDLPSRGRLDVGFTFRARSIVPASGPTRSGAWRVPPFPSPGRAEWHIGSIRCVGRRAPPLVSFLRRRRRGGGRSKKRRPSPLPGTEMGALRAPAAATFGVPPRSWADDGRPESMKDAPALDRRGPSLAGFPAAGTGLAAARL